MLLWTWLLVLNTSLSAGHITNKFYSTFPAILAGNKARKFVPDKFTQNSERELREGNSCGIFVLFFGNNDFEEKTELQMADSAKVWD